MYVGADSMTAEFSLQQDPRSTATDNDLRAQFDFLKTIRDELTDIHRTIKEIRTARGQIDAVLERAEGTEAHDVLKEGAEPLLERIKAVEEALFQTRVRSRQDPLNFPIRLNDKLAGVASTVGVGEWPPTDQARAVYDELHAQIQEQLDAWAGMREADLGAFNARVAELEIPAIRLGEADD
jgi:hypothetical protein